MEKRSVDYVFQSWEVNPFSWSRRSMITDRVQITNQSKSTTNTSWEWTLNATNICNAFSSFYFRAVRFFGSRSCLKTKASACPTGPGILRAPRPPIQSAPGSRRGGGWCKTIQTIRVFFPGEMCAFTVYTSQQNQNARLAAALPLHGRKLKLHTSFQPYPSF